MKWWPLLLVGALVGAFMALNNPERVPVPPTPGPRKKRTPLDKSKHFRKVTPPAPPKEEPKPEPPAPKEGEGHAKE